MTARSGILAVVVAVAIAAGGCERGADVGKLIGDAQAQRNSGQYAAAIIHLKNALAAAPDNGEVRQLLGLTYLDAGDAASAEKELRRAVELKYRPQVSSIALGRALLRLGQAQKVLDEVKLDDTADPALRAEALTLHGLAHTSLGRPAEGARLLDQALVLKPDSADALLGKARVLLVTRQRDEAEKLIDQAIAADPRAIDAWLMKGDLSQTTSVETAVAAYSKVIEIQPENVPARLSLALVQVGAGKLAEARTLVAAARKSSPNVPMAHYVQALIEFRDGKLPAARDAVQIAIKGAPNHLPTVLLAGAVEYSLGSHVLAQSHLSRVVERVPTILYARKLLISSLAKSGQAQRAAELVEPALRQFPDDGALLALAGEVSMLTNDLAKANQYFAKAASADPKSSGARTGLALSRLASGETERGLADLEAATQVDAGRYQADVLLVVSQLQRGNFEMALKAVQTLEKKQPDNPLTHNLKAAIFLGRKDTASARKSLERALELQPAYVPAAANLAQLDLQDKNPVAARGRLEAILKKDPNNTQALITLASLAPRLGAGPKDQIAWLERAASGSPTTVQPQMLLARAHLQGGDPKKALEVALRAQAANAENPEVLDGLGAIQIAAGEKNQALTTYGKLVTLQPNSHVALLRLAGAQVANEKPGDATASLKKALALKPDFLEAQIALAEIEMKVGRAGEALKIAQQVQKQAPKSPAGHVLEGDILMADRKFPQAARAYETAHGISKSGRTAMKLHAAYSRAGRPDEAQKHLNQWLAASPEDATVRLYAAESGLREGNFKASIEQYEWLQKRQPENVVVLNNLAWAYMQAKDSRALATAEQAYKIRPDSPAIADTLGWILTEQGNAARGVEILQKAAGAAPKAQEIRFHLAQALEKSGDKARAIRELETLLASDQKFPREGEAVALLKKLRN